MRAVTIKSAKAHLNELVEAAIRGEQIVLMRGPEHVAAIVPITSKDLELSPALSDAQAERLWRDLQEEHRRGKIRELPNMEKAVRVLSGLPESIPVSRRRRSRTTRRR